MAATNNADPTTIVKTPSGASALQSATLTANGAAVTILIP